MLIPADRWEALYRETLLSKNDLLSILHDTRVYILIKAIEDKIVHAFDDIDTVEKFLDIPALF